MLCDIDSSTLQFPVHPYSQAHYIDAKMDRLKQEERKMEELHHTGRKKAELKSQIGFKPECILTPAVLGCITAGTSTILNFKSSICIIMLVSGYLSSK